MKSYVHGSWRFILVCSAVALCLAGHATAVTVTLEPSQDNTLYEENNGALSNGAGQHLFAGRTGPGGGTRLMRGLIKFDVDRVVPPGSIINSVELNLNVSTPQEHPGTVLLHPVQVPWGEGLSVALMGEGVGAASTVGDATWIHSHFDIARWNTPGGDFNPAPSASFAVTNPGPYLIGTTPELVADVQGWLDDPASNNGWLMRLEDENSLAIRFDSRENVKPDGQRPLLVIDFSLPPLLISPQSGLFALTQVSDIVVFVTPPDGVTVIGAMVFLDGNDVTSTFGACFLGNPGTVLEGGQTFRCAQQAAENIGPGSHTFEAVIALSDGTSVQRAVEWTIIPNTEP